MKRLTPVRAIRLKCLDCSGNHPSEVRNCSVVDCPLYPYRMGRNPKREGIGNQKGGFYEKPSTQQVIPEVSRGETG